MCGITQAELKSILSYDPETGEFTWLVSHKMAGKKAGTPTDSGYVQIGINGKVYIAHRLAWFYVYGEFPTNEIDHINGVRNDNRIENLRESSSSQNKCNTGISRVNTSGFKGVSWHAISGKWQVHIGVGKKKKYLGLFPTAELASGAYNAKAVELHGEFYRNTLTLENNDAQMAALAGEENVDMYEHENCAKG